MARYKLHRLDGRIIGPIPGDHLLHLCSEGRAFADESLSSADQPGAARPLSAVPKLADALAAGRAARSARSAKAVPAVTEELRRAVVQIRTPTGSGSGFAIDGEGTVVTNRHVVEDSTTCTVHFDSGAISPGVVVFRSAHADFAIVRVAIPTPEHMCLSERRGDDVAVGEQVIAFGFPQDAGFNVTVGVVSASQVRMSQSESSAHGLHPWIRTSAEINRGNSGGPLVNLHGSVVGMACWGQVFDRAGDGVPVAGMNYCIPHAILCRESREFHRAVSERTIRVPSADEILRGSHQPDAWDELDLALSLICSRYGMRVVNKVPWPNLSRGFRHVSLVTSVGDQVDIYVDSFVFNNGPPYVTMYCEVGDMSAKVLGDAKAMADILRHNTRLPHWNFALKEDRLVLRFSRELELLDAVEVVNALQDLTIVLDTISSED
jgi:hypothetical protein